MKNCLSLINRAVCRIVMALLCCASIATPYRADALGPPKPLVAIHVSELTQALETAPAIPPTPTGPGYSGFQWFYTSWHYFVAYESLKEALRSDGTPFAEISDSDIAAGKLLDADGLPRYPILISLASEAIADNEIPPLRDYVAAGGFLLVGSSSFTRYPDGANRTDFALADEMGLHKANATLDETNNWNWYVNNHFTKSLDHRLTSHIPGGTLAWSGPMTAEEIPWGVSPGHLIHSGHYAWQVVASGAAVIAYGDVSPLLAVKDYGHGQIIYHGALQPLVGHGVIDPAMYSYQVYRKAIDWAFESFKLPLVKVSPWRYQHDAAFLVRHDFEVSIDLIKSVEASAQFEHSLGALGDYYFTTGALRSYTGSDKAAIISGLRNAVTTYGATIGPHNGGLKNPRNPLLQQTDLDYWHWGPDEALDVIPSGYTSGKAYAAASVSASYLDIEGWLAGVDNGRPGCAAAGNCPKSWASPYFNSTREDSKDVLEQSGAITMGEQKVGPLPHFTLSYRVPGKHFSHISMPTSDWFIGTTTARALDIGHTFDSIRSAVDFYYDSGLLLNFYGHEPSNNSGLAEEYVRYSVLKPRLWRANTVGIHDWWLARSKMMVLPEFTVVGDTYILSATVSGATDADSALEIVLPKIPDQPVADLSVLLDGVPAASTEYRATSYGIKVRTGYSVANVKVQYLLQASNLSPTAVNDSFSTASNTALSLQAPGVLANDTDPEAATLTAQVVSGPSHGIMTLNSDGSFTYIPAADYIGSDSFSYVANDGSTNSNVATVAITVAPAGYTLFSDDFSRPADSASPLLPWIASMGTWTVTGGVMQGSGGRSQYSYAYTAGTPLWTDYMVQGRIQIPAGAFGGGIGGRLDPASGAHYGAWVYPTGSPGGSNMLKLWKFNSWTDLGAGVPMQQVSLPVVGTGWHTLKMNFVGNRILVYYDGVLKLDVTDTNYGSRAAYLSGGVSADWWTWSLPYTLTVDDIYVVSATSPETPVPVINALTPASANAGGAAFTLSVTGSGFVSGSAVQWNGVSRTTTYVSATQLTAAITAADIATAGTASVTVFNPAPGGGISNAQTFTISTPDNPLPVITTLNPASANAGGAAFTLSVTGSGFVNGSTVQWNGVSRTTTYINATQLTAAIPAADIATAGTVSVTVFNPAPGGGTSNILIFTIIDTNLFADDFSRPVDSTSPLSPWVASMGTWTVANGVMLGSGGRSQYSYAYTSGTPVWTDYVVQGRIQIPAGSFGGGIGGRVDPATGAHYGAWVYPTGSPGGSNLLKLWKFRSWTDIGAGVPMQQVTLPVVGTGWHTLQLSFIGNRIRVYYDGTLRMDVMDNNYDSRAAYLSGGISADWWTWSLPYTITVDDVSVVAQ